MAPIRAYAAIATSAFATTALAQTSGDFNALAFNVAGLPGFLNDNGVPGDKDTNTKLMGSVMAQHGFDIIQVQEDFNYHDELYETDNHPHRSEHSGGAGFGSGLNTLSNFPFSTYQRVKWKDCHGIFDSANDCLTPKGFTFARHQVAPGVEVDSYNVHMDAGSKDGDFKARKGNFNQLAEFIGANSANNPVLIFGDFNSRYTKEKDSIRALTQTMQPPMKDVWVQLVLGGTEPAIGAPANECPNPQPSGQTGCEIIDKVLYRSSAKVELTPTGFDYIASWFFQPDGSIVSDHNPVLANFTYNVIG